MPTAYVRLGEAGNEVSASEWSSDVCDETVGSAQDREHEVGDPVAGDAERRVAEQDVLRGELAEEGPVARAHHLRHQVDGHLVQQPQLQALPGDGSPGDGD